MTANDGNHGLAAPETLKAMSGLEFLTAIKEGRLPPAPMAETLNFYLSEVTQRRKKCKIRQYKYQIRGACGA